MGLGWNAFVVGVGERKDSGRRGSTAGQRLNKWGLPSISRVVSSAAVPGQLAVVRACLLEERSRTSRGRGRMFGGAKWKSDGQSKILARVAGGDVAVLVVGSPANFTPEAATRGRSSVPALRLRPCAAVQPPTRVVLRASWPWECAC